MESTITFSEKVKGWTSFHSYFPEFMARVNNRFFTIKNGQLWQHNDETNPLRNRLYGQKVKSKVTIVFNEKSNEDYIFKTIMQESNSPWSVTVRTNLAESTIKKEEFNTRESRHFAYIRKNEKDSDLRGHTAQGIGVISSFSGLQITFSSIPYLVNVGDRLYQLNNGVDEMIGTIEEINGNVITVDIILAVPVPGYFSFCKKIGRIEGSELRGYYLEVDLENDDDGRAELFAVNTNAVKSGVGNV